MALASSKPGILRLVSCQSISHQTVRSVDLCHRPMPQILKCCLHISWRLQLNKTWSVLLVRIRLRVRARAVTHPFTLSLCFLCWHPCLYLYSMGDWRLGAVPAVSRRIYYFSSWHTPAPMLICCTGMSDRGGARAADPFLTRNLNTGTPNSVCGFCRRNL